MPAISASAKPICLFIVVGPFRELSSKRPRLRLR
nr:MAG TPA: hypothetical protein [Caudoviricetes sp.]